IKLRHLIPAALLFAAVLIAEAIFSISFVGASSFTPQDASLSQVGVTSSIGAGLFTIYLLPFEITSLLLLMAIVGAMSLARSATVSTGARVVAGRTVLPRHIIAANALADDPILEGFNAAQSEDILGEHAVRDDED